MDAFNVAPVAASIEATSAIALSLSDLKRHRFPPRRALLTRADTPILSSGDLVEVYAERGLGKTWFVGSLALAAAAGVEVLGFRAPTSCRVLVIDGEMASQDLQERFARLENMLGISAEVPLDVLAADWQPDYLPRLDTPDGQAYVEPFVAAADLVVLDNRGCLFDPEGEKDPVAWQPAQDWLLSLRRRGKAVIVAHHANKMGGSRGHSKSQDPLNTVVRLTRPEGYHADQGARFEVTFEKSRSAHGPAVAPFTARLTPEGWQIEHSGADPVRAQLLENVRVAAHAGQPIKSANAAIKGIRGNRQTLLTKWGDLVKGGQVAKGPDGGYLVA